DVAVPLGLHLLPVALGLGGSVVCLRSKLGRTVVRVPSRIVHLFLDVGLALLGRGLHRGLCLVDLHLESFAVVRHLHCLSPFGMSPAGCYFRRRESAPRVLMRNGRTGGADTTATRSRTDEPERCVSPTW